MSMFGEYMRQLIQSRGMSVSKLSKESGVERTLIHKSLTGERILPYRALEMLIRNLKLSPRESQRLKQYYDELFEGENVSKIRDITGKLLLQLSETLALQPDRIKREAGAWFRDGSSLGAFSASGKSTYRGYGEIRELLRYLAAEELKCKEAELELAVPYQARPVMECVRMICRGGLETEISHIVCLDAFDLTGESNVNNMAGLSHMLPECMLSERRYHIWYYYSDMLQSRFTDPLPYFLVTHSGAVCFSDDCQMAILLQEQEQITYFRNCFYSLRESCRELAEYVKVPEAVSDFFPNDFGWAGCCDIMPQLGIRQMQPDGLTMLYRQRGIRNFLENVRDGFVQVFSGEEPEENGREEHRKLLWTLLDAVREDQVKGRIINEARFPFSESLTVLISEEGGAFLCRRGEKQGVRLLENSMCKAIYDWGMHLSGSDRVFGKEKTIGIFERLLEENFPA